MRTLTASDAAKAVVRLNTEEVQGKGDFDVFEELFWDDFDDHTTQPGTTPDLVLSGELEAMVGGETFTLRAGETLIAPRNIPHDPLVQGLRHDSRYNTVLAKVGLPLRL